MMILWNVYISVSKTASAFGRPTDLHGSDERQQAIAAALSRRAAAELKEAQDNGALKRSSDGTSG
jgi:hypothetical protein